MGQISEWVLSVMAKFGYFGIVFAMFAENVFPPIPSEVIMPAAGFAVAQGDLNLIAVILAGTTGSVLGALPLYYIGACLMSSAWRMWHSAMANMSLSNRTISPRPTHGLISMAKRRCFLDAWCLRFAH